MVLLIGINTSLVLPEHYFRLRVNGIYTQVIIQS